MYQPTVNDESQVNIRNTRDGIVFELPEENDIEIVIEQLHDFVRDGGEVFHNAEVIIDFCDRPPDGIEAKQIELALEAAGVRVRRVTASRPGLRPEPRPIPGKSLTVISRTDQLPTITTNQERIAKYVRGKMSAGKKIVSEGDLLLLGDVEPGAELIAGGDVVIWGALRGSVRAGTISAAGNAMVCALLFQPTQIRIGRMVATPTNSEVFDTSTPQQAYRDGNSIIVKPWSGYDEGS